MDQNQTDPSPTAAGAEQHSWGGVAAVWGATPPGWE